MRRAEASVSVSKPASGLGLVHHLLALWGNKTNCGVYSSSILIFPFQVIKNQLLLGGGLFWGYLVLLLFIMFLFQIRSQCVGLASLELAM